jgi:hypothetical protein
MISAPTRERLAAFDDTFSGSDLEPVPPDPGDQGGGDAVLPEDDSMMSARESSGAPFPLPLAGGPVARPTPRVVLSLARIWTSGLGGALTSRSGVSDQVDDAVVAGHSDASRRRQRA